MGRAGAARKPVPARVFLRANMTLLLYFDFIYCTISNLISTLPPDLSKPPDGLTFINLWELTHFRPSKLAQYLI